MDTIIVLALFGVALFYLYIKLVKKKGCSGCSQSKGGCMSGAKGAASCKSKTVYQEIYQAEHEASDEPNDAPASQSDASVIKQLN
ncbi:FeoB-associated Cys-rich membrane protein [Ignatzschineria sp. RMDPL8A]|uniref:FeoB-associated Cys-rich membrane protein n=1 Tax=Ignatzschineria sp. RMDPL8A TaxID=2999236 RepID=UPI0024467272|nr:FeoB-associated Cys-rich membrane protein [Ignatzschineria sp. RMDPL8A]MDG9729120.1 FeoB-associated Cys-rich membrane protein [Ignatzschineria sp. RMDPL8A]